MGCQATCAVASDRSGMMDVLVALGIGDGKSLVENALDCTESEPPVPPVTNSNESIVPVVFRYGELFVVLLAMRRSSAMVSMTVLSMLRSLPSGLYGVAYSLAWDADNDGIYLCADYRPYHGGGEEVPYQLMEWPRIPRQVDVLWRKVDRRLRRGLDMSEAGVQWVAETESMRAWLRAYVPDVAPFASGVIG